MNELDGYVRSGLGAGRETVDVRDGERVEGDEMRIKIQVLQLLYSFVGKQEGGGATFLCKLVREVEEWSHVAKSKPREHD